MSPDASREKWVLASSNRGKLGELTALLASFGIEPIAQDALGVVAVAETGATFVENALLKARNAAAQTGLPALADDSGLVVDALGGAPGIYSARFAGLDATDEQNVALLLEQLAAVPIAARSAHFHCSIVLLRSATDPAPLVAQGEWHGAIAPAPRGARGFGYDPIFVDPALGETAAELDASVKNRVSHRGRALAALTAALGSDDTRAL